VEQNGLFIGQFSKEIQREYQWQQFSARFIESSPIINFSGGSNVHPLGSKVTVVQDALS
jgi:hypothetical protein